MKLMPFKRNVFILSFVIFLIIGVIYNIIFIDNTRYIEKILSENEFIEVNQVKIYSSTNTEIVIDNLIQEELNILNQDLADLFDYTPGNKLNIIIFNDIKDLEKRSGLDDIGAFFDHKSNTIALPISESLNNEPIFLKYLRHEYTHYYLTSYLNDKNISSIPIWFDEGLAEYVSISMKGDYAVIPTEKIIDFTLLNTRRDWAKYRKKSSELYIQSHFAINYIIKKKDPYVIKKIIDESKQLDFSEVFSENTGIPLSELNEKIDLNENN